MNKTKSYALERYISKDTGWVDEGVNYDTYEESIEDLEFHRKLYPQEKFRIKEEYGYVIYRRYYNVKSTNGKTEL